MSVNFLRSRLHGAGPAHLLTNPAPRSCVYIALMNFFIAAGAFTALIYGSYARTSFGAEVPQYLCVVALLGAYSGLYYLHLAKRRQRSDSEWSHILIKIFLLNLMQYALIVWGAGLCYRMISSKQLVGTRMYYYLYTGKWMDHTILSISSFNCLCIVYTSYIALVVMLVSLVNQELQRLLDLNPTCILEMGSGSGALGTFLLQLLKSKGLHSMLVACDINPNACLTTQQTAKVNGVGLSVDAVHGSLMVPFRGKNPVMDVVLFNPPYVPTDSISTKDNIEASWAGGINGAEVIKQFISEIPMILSVHGYLYLLLEEKNEPSTIQRLLKQHGLSSTIIMCQKRRNEKLMILRCSHA